MDQAKSPFSSFGRQYDYDMVTSRELKCIGQHIDDKDSGGKYILIGDEDLEFGIFNRPLPCFGCGIGWFSFLLGFLCPLLWYCATILYFSNYYRKDPRERAGLAASAIAALVCTVAVSIIGLAILI